MDAATDSTEIHEYNPDRLLDALRDNLYLKNDAALSRMLQIAPPVISKIRHRRLQVSAAVLIRMHEVSGLNISDLRFLLGDRRRKFRISDVQGRPKIVENPLTTWSGPVDTRATG